MDEKKWEIARFIAEKASQALAAITSPQRAKSAIIATAEGRRHEMLLMEKTEQDIKDVRVGKKKITEDGKVVGVEEDLPFSSLAEALNRDIGARLREVSSTLPLVLSQSDLTLRGHYPGEVEKLNG